MTTNITTRKGWHSVEVVPTYVTIPVPQALDYNNGARFYGAQARIRRGDAILVPMSRAQGALIRDEASRIGVPYASFMRWCALMTCKALLKERTGEDLQIEL
jgi:hypothetical protein